MKYFENFKSIDDVRGEFQIADDLIKDEEVLFAYYGYGSYCGSATVLFQRDGKLYEVTGAHCSCYGIENQWDPQEVTWPQLAMRKGDYAYFDDDEGDMAKKALKELIENNVGHA